jgi:hypothetical protein
MNSRITVFEKQWIQISEIEETLYESS